MIVSEIDREKRVVLVDRSEASDLAALFLALSLPCGAPMPGPEPGVAIIPLPERLDEAEIARAEVLVAEFNKMRSSRASNRALDG